MIKNILEGHVRELLGFNKDLSKSRMDICKTCPIFSELFGGMCNRKFYINPETEDISTEEKDGYYRGCGCRLLAKTTGPEESCPAGKW